jgi:carbon-monoxide dehydrogenase large subunit
MADEVYRAVFLRVHPTGKMVLSLTTEPDGHEAQYAETVAGVLGVPALDVKVVPADADRFGTGHGYNTSPSSATAAAVRSATGKILDKARLLAGVALDTPPEQVRWTDGAFSAGDGESGQQTIAEVAIYAHGTGQLPPGVEGGLDAQTVYRD